MIDNRKMGSKSNDAGKDNIFQSGKELSFESALQKVLTRDRESIEMSLLIAIMQAKHKHSNGR